MNSNPNKRLVFLLEDEDLPLENIFDAQEVDVDIVVAKNKQDALEKLTKLHEQGIVPDIISCDIFLKDPKQPPEYAQNFLDEAFKLFGDKPIYRAHSMDRLGEDNKIPPIKLNDQTIPILLSRDFRAIVALSQRGRFYNGKRLKDTDDDSINENIEFRELFNEVLGTSFPLSMDELPEDFQWLDGLAIEEILDAAEGDPQTFLEVFATKFDSASLETFLPKSIITNKPQYEGIEFGMSVGDSTTGRIAVSLEDVKKIKENNAKTGRKDKIVFCLQSYNPELLSEVLNDVDAVVLVGGGTGHLHTVLENSGKAGILGISQDSETQLEVTEKGLKFPDGYKFPDGFEINGHKPILKSLKPGAFVTLETHMAQDGKTTGFLYPQELDVAHIDIENEPWYKPFMDMLKQIKDDYKLQLPKTGANADTPDQVRKAKKLGADCISLARTEHTVIGHPEIMSAIKEILTDGCSQSCQDFGEKQRQHMIQMLKAAQNADGSFLPLRVRLLDAPADEFLSAEEMKIFNTRDFGKGSAKESFNQEECLRGVQLAFKTPGLYEAQIIGMLDAALDMGATQNVVEILVPNTKRKEDLEELREFAFQQAELRGMTIEFGTMDETPEACNQIEEIVPLVEIVSFGTGDMISGLMQSLRSDVSAALDWAKANAAPGKNPYFSMTNPLSDILENQVRRILDTDHTTRISWCGPHVAHDIKALELAYGLELSSVSVPMRKIPWAKVGLMHIAVKAEYERRLRPVPISELSASPACVVQ